MKKLSDKIKNYSDSVKLMFTIEFGIMVAIWILFFQNKYNLGDLIVNNILCVLLMVVTIVIYPMIERLEEK